MPKKTRVGIYHPPKSGMPYIVVTVSPEGVTATVTQRTPQGPMPRRRRSAFL